MILSSKPSSLSGPVDGPLGLTLLCGKVTWSLVSLFACTHADVGPILSPGLLSFHETSSCWNSWLSWTPRSFARWTPFCWLSIVNSWLLSQDAVIVVLVSCFSFSLSCLGSTHLTIRWSRFCMCYSYSIDQTLRSLKAILAISFIGPASLVSIKTELLKTHRCDYLRVAC